MPLAGCDNPAVRDRAAVLGFWFGSALAAIGAAWIAACAPDLSLPAIALAATGWVLSLACADRSRARARWIFIAALAVRTGPWLAGPRLSDDIHRYAWEGAVVASGRSAYALAPDDPQLADLAASEHELHDLVAHREVAAAYPPMAQGIHALAWVVAPVLGGARAHAAETILRAVYLAADLAVLALLVVLLRRRGLPEARAVAWAWCPTCALEFAGSGHLDSLAIALLLAAWLVGERASSRVRAACAAALLGGAILMRYLPLAALPAWLRARRERWLGVVVLALVSVAAWAPFVALGGVFAGVTEYGARWEGFNLAFRPISSAVRALLGTDTDPREVARAARLVCAVAWCAVTAFALWITRRDRDELRATSISIAAFLALTPVVHPWYLTWMAPFVALRRDAEWIWLLAVAPLLYAPLESWRSDGVWREPAWTWPALALPFFALLAARIVRGRSRGVDPAPAVRGA